MKKPRAAVRLSLEAVARLLHLREGLTVTGVEFHQRTEDVTFFLKGDGLPGQHAREEAEIVRLATVTDPEFL